MTDDTPITPAELAQADRVLSRFPATRGDCPPVDVPCPFVTCRHHLWIELGYVWKHGRVWQESPVFGDHERTCSLRFADTGPHTLEYTAIMMGVTRERIRQIEKAICKHIRNNNPEVLREFLDYLNLPPERDTSGTDWAEPENDEQWQGPEDITFSPRLQAILVARRYRNNQDCKKVNHAKRTRHEGQRGGADGNDPDPESVACRVD